MMVPASDVKATEHAEFVIITERDLTTLSMTPQAYAHFVTLLRRGVNTWDSAPIEVKQLADIVLNVPVKS